jgi:hypothetical protein
VIRVNATALCVFRFRSEQELVAICEEISVVYPKDTVIALIRHATEQPYSFLYVDLDTAVIQSLEKIFDLIREPEKFITLEDFWQKDQLATALVWFPKDCEKVRKVWNDWIKIGFATSWRMDYFLRKVVKPDLYWQQLTSAIYDFKPKTKMVLDVIPEDAIMVCFHGKPRIYQVVESSLSLRWVNQYVNQTVFSKVKGKKNVSVIIPYNIDRGWLKEAVASVPLEVQLILSQGAGTWPANFNKALPQAEGLYIKYLHEDDMLTPNCIKDSVDAMQAQDVDIIHGKALQLSQKSGTSCIYKPGITHPTLENMLAKNIIHSATLMYRREVFEKVGVLNESVQVKGFEEYEFNLRCLRNGLKIGYCDSVLAIYRRHRLQQIRTVNRNDRLRYRRELINHYKSN